MQIQLKQSEIVEALKQYIVTKGISLAGKTVEVGFTAGRTPTGLTTEITIEDAEPAVEQAGTYKRAIPGPDSLVQEPSVAQQNTTIAVPAVEIIAGTIDGPTVTKSASSLFN